MLHIYKASVRTNTASASHTHYTIRLRFNPYPANVEKMVSS